MWLGTQLDSGGGAGRWKKWRLVEQAALTASGSPYCSVRAFVYAATFGLSAAVFVQISQTLVTLVPLAINDPWD